jgi:hypothetical protein
MQIEWDDPRVLKIGAAYRRQAYDLADEFNSYGADATRLLDNNCGGPDQVCVPTKFADAIMALLLSLPRAKRGRRPKPSTLRFKRLVWRGLSKRKASRIESSLTCDETGEQIRRRGRSSGPKLRKRPKPP